MSRLVGSHSKKRDKKYVCDHCFCLFWKQDSLDKHIQYCKEHDAIKTLMPIPGVNDILRFKNTDHQVPVPIMFTADFESFTKPINITHSDTKLYQRHEPSAFRLYTISCVEGFSPGIIMFAKTKTITLPNHLIKQLRTALKKFTKSLRFLSK